MSPTPSWTLHLGIVVLEAFGFREFGLRALGTVFVVQRKGLMGIRLRDENRFRGP